MLIVSVEPRRDFWKIRTDADTTVYTTKNPYVASLCKHWQERKHPIALIASAAGWHFREIYSIRPEGGEPVLA